MDYGAAPLPTATITGRLMALAGERGSRLALVPMPAPLLPGRATRTGTRSPGARGRVVPGTPAGLAGKAYTYRGMAAAIGAIAAGLARSGLAPGDAVGVLVLDAISQVLASHAIRAAGGVPSPVDPGLGVTEVAGQLAESGARMLITVAELAGVAAAAADQCWVRQVFSFGAAPSARPVGTLLGHGSLRPARAHARELALLPFSRGRDGRLRPVPVSHADLAAQVAELDRTGLFTGSDIVVAAPPCGDGLRYAVLTDAVVLGGATLLAAAPGSLRRACATWQATAAIVPAGQRAALPGPVRPLLT